MTGSRERILRSIATNKPLMQSLPEIPRFQFEGPSPLESFIAVATNIGSTVVKVQDTEGIRDYIKKHFSGLDRLISRIEGLDDMTESLSDADPHDLENVQLAILNAAFGVAENGALWVSDELMGERALPFITQHLALVVKATDMVPLMHDAYERLGNRDYDYAAFIAGPSKTADIEQSLVIGAHGPRSLTIFICEDDFK